MYKKISFKKIQIVIVYFVYYLFSKKLGEHLTPLSIEQSQEICKILWLKL